MTGPAARATAHERAAGATRSTGAVQSAGAQQLVRLLHVQLWLSAAVP